MTPLLSVQGLGVYTTAGGARPILRDVSFDVAPGETLGIVGESGSGKTSLALALLGLLPSGLRAEGRVLFEGRDLGLLDARARRDLRGRRLAMVFQEPFTALNPRMRVGAQVAEVATAHGERNARRAAHDAVEMLGHVGITEPEDRAQRLPHQLSGGERQRVLLAMALLLQPALLIADVTVQAQVLELLRERQRESAMALLLISHDAAVVAGSCARTLVLHEGRIVEDAPTRQLFTAPQHPHTVALLAAAQPLGSRT